MILILLRRYWLHALVASALAWGVYQLYGEYEEWRDSIYQSGYNAANVRAEKIIADFAKAEAEAQTRARAAESYVADALAKASDEADKRNDQIDRDYERRIAGAESERDKLRVLWQAKQATDRLADSAGAAAEAAEQDRLRRASAARIVRAVERVQSERDEVIGRYEAVRNAVNELKRSNTPRTAD